MLAHALDEDTDLAHVDPEAFAAEWKWDGVRVQAVREDGVARLYSRTGEDLSAAFPDLVSALTFEGVIDGELLVRQGDTIGSFSDLQQRLNRKSATAKLQAQYPAMLRAYDLLSEGGEDLRALPFRTRRERLEPFVLAHGGEWSLHDRQPHGLIVRIQLPVRQPSRKFWPACLAPRRQPVN